MDIDDINFAGVQYNFHHPLAQGMFMRIGDDECIFLRETYSEEGWRSSWREMPYIQELAKYKSRFGTDMPAAIRLERLRSITLNGH